MGAIKKVQKKPNFSKKLDIIFEIGARNRNRTGTVSLPQDFKSCASTYSAIWALFGDSLEIRTPDPLIKSQVLYQLS